jgi:hypothetical protein
VNPVGHDGQSISSQRVVGARSSLSFPVTVVWMLAVQAGITGVSEILCNRGELYFAGILSPNWVVKRVNAAFESCGGIVKRRLLSNVWCSQCRRGVSIRNFTGAFKAGELAGRDLLGMSRGCGEVVEFHDRP